MSNIYFENAVKSVKEWVKIKSVKSEKTQNAPFGEGVKTMLNKALFDAQNLGFEVKNYDNYVGEVIFGDGNDEDGFAILCHLDVVPEGDENKWTYPPYSATEVNGEIYGRGIVDDKAPACLVLHALKELKDKGFKPKRKIKLILGCDEESGWGCIDYYNSHAVMPIEGFSPDGDFPVIYAEKGILHITYEFSKNERILNILGGEKNNMVSDKAEVEILNATEKELMLASDFGGIVERNKVYFSGRSAHGSTPELGENANGKMLNFLSEIGLFNKNDYANLFLDKLGLTKLCDETGNLTFSPNVIKVNGNKISVTVDVRYPATLEKEFIVNELEKVGKITCSHYQPPLFKDKNDSLIKTLLDIYNEKFSKNEKPIAIGGGTYARALKSGVAFGPSFTENNLCHVPNEKMSLTHLEKCYYIYKEVIEKLC